MKRLSFVLVIFIFAAAIAAAQQADSNSFSQEGIASWYGAQFAGKPTASGEIFNPAQFTAAHPVLPFGTVLTVTNKQNMRKVTVRVNDRGPFVGARIIDLSMAAAEALDMISTGTAPVTLERALSTAALGPAASSSVAITQAAASVSPPEVSAIPSGTLIPQAARPPESSSPPPAARTLPKESPLPAPLPAAAASPSESSPAMSASPPPVEERFAAPGTPSAAGGALPSADAFQAASTTSAPAPLAAYSAASAKILGGIPQAASGKSYRLQVGAYRVPRNALDAFNKLKNAGLNPAYEQNGELYRVVLAGLRAEDIPAIARTLGLSGFPEAIIREESGN